GERLEDQIQGRAAERAVSGRGLDGERVAENDRLAAHGALSGRVDVAREAPGTVRNALEAREARDVDDIRAAFALHDVEPEEIDSECRSATSRDVLELGSEGERLTPLFLGSAPRANPDYAEPLAPERVDLAVRRPVRRVVRSEEHTSELQSRVD